MTLCSFFWATGIRRGAHWQTLCCEQHGLGKSHLAGKGQKLMWCWLAGLAGCLSQLSQALAEGNVQCSMQDVIVPIVSMLLASRCLVASLLPFCRCKGQACHTAHPAPLLSPGCFACPLVAWLLDSVAAMPWPRCPSCCPAPGGAHACRTLCLAIRHSTSQDCNVKGFMQVCWHRALTQHVAKGVWDTTQYVCSLRKLL